MGFVALIEQQHGFTMFYIHNINVFFSNDIYFFHPLKSDLYFITKYKNCIISIEL